MQAVLLSGTVVVSLLVGSFITLSVVDDDSAEVPQPAATATVTPVVTTSAGASPTVERVSTGVLAGLALPDLIEATTPSVADIDLLNSLGLPVGGGSGVVIDKDGHILTNWHVVQAATGDIQVNLWDGTAALARVLGTDPSNDLAVLKIDVDPDILHPATFGDSDAVRIGDAVFAMGSPFDQDFSVTAGIISAKGRESVANLPGIRANRNLLQTDAPINPGNSGGPLFNMNGEVVGINVSINTSSGDFDGLGFSIPSNTVVRFLPQLIAAEPIVHAQLGVIGNTLNELRAEAADLSVSRGFLVTTATGGAADAGIRSDDVITSIDGVLIRDFQDLVFAIDLSDVGDVVPVEVNRDGEVMTFDVTLQPWTPRQ
jgi:putative serine protease PepD